MDNEEKTPLSADDRKSDTPPPVDSTEATSTNGAATDGNNSQSFGHWLKEQRTRKNINLEEIAAVTKVHIQQLRALEEDNRTKLPAAAFVRGFLVSYARHLEIDENEVLSRYKTAYGSLTPMNDLLVASSGNRVKNPEPKKIRMVSQPNIRQAPAVREIEKPASNFLSFRNIILAVVLLAVVALVATLIFIGKKDRALKGDTETATTSASTEATPPVVAKTETPTETKPETKAPTKAEAAKAAAEKAAADKAAAAEKSAEAAKVAAAAKSEPTVTGNKKYKAELRALESTWVNIRVDNGNSKGTLVRNGSMLPLEADEKVTLVISNAANIEIRWNGTWYQPTGSRGEVKSVTLPDQLETLVALKGPGAPKKAKATAAPATPATEAPAAAEAATPPAQN